MMAAAKPLPAFHPVEGLEANDAGYIDWLLAGGAPLPEFHALAWADTAKDDLL
jgi:hypothetical protein